MYCYQVANSSPPSPLSLLSPQIAAKMGGDQMSHMNNSSPILDPSLYGYGGQKRSMDDGGKPVVDLFTYRHTQCMWSTSILNNLSAKHKPQHLSRLQYTKRGTL